MAPVKERRAREREQLRQEILDAARDLFIREGYESLSMRRIAEKIEYSPTTIYLYFKDKSDLLYNLCEETFARLVREFKGLEQESSDSVVCLRKGLRAYVEFGLKYPNHYRVTFMSPAEPEAKSDKYLNPNSMGMKAFGFLPRLVGEAVRQGKFRNVDVLITSQALWAAVHGVTSLLIAHRKFPWTDKGKVIDHLIDTLLAGCCCQKEGDRCCCQPSDTQSKRQ